MTTPILVNGRYRLVNKVGEGGMGEVYQALDRLTGEHVALKRVTTAPVSGSAPSTDADDLRLWSLHLAREFQLLASLRHPNIISVLDYGIELSEAGGDPQLYYTMQFLRGGRTILQAAHALPVEDRIPLLVELLEALAYLHRRDILHRDLKPANILVDQSGQVKVVDFGLSSLREPSSSDKMREAMGTLTYMAPEILRNGAPSEASDLFAVGIVACEMLTGTYPFDRSTVTMTIHSILDFEPDLTPLYYLDLPVEKPQDELTLDSLFLTSAPTLPSVIRRLLEKDPADRYQRAQDVIADLAAAGLTIRPQSVDVRDSFIKAARLIGRDAELRRLRAALADALEGKGSAFLVGGESGVGKSRLLNELRTYALIGGAQVLTGQAVESGGSTYQLWRDPLRRLVLTTPLSDLQSGVLKDLIPDIDALLEHPVDRAPVLDGSYEHQRLLQTIRHLVITQPRPTVLILEDLQWGRESLNVLKMFLGLVKAHPLLIIGSYREEEAAGLVEEFPQMIPIRLEKLPPEGVGALSRSMIGEHTAPDLISLLQHETGGNVLFIVEVVRSLADAAGALDKVGSATLPFAAVTGGIQAVLRRRIESLPAEARPMLDAAAVAGRVLDLKLMETLWASAPLPKLGSTPSTWLFACGTAAVLDVFDGQWRFTHDKLREVLLIDLEKSGDLPRISGIVAQGIEDTYPDVLERGLRAEGLAELWRKAGNAERELESLETATKNAFENIRYKETLTLAERARALVKDDPERYGQLMAMSSYAHYALRQQGETHQTSYRALEALGFSMLDKPGEQRRAFVVLLLTLIYRRVRPFKPKSSEKDDRNVTALRLLLRLTLIHIYGNVGVAMAYYALMTANIAEQVSRARSGERARFYATAAVALGFSNYRLARLAMREAKVMLEWTNDPDAIMYVTQAMGILSIIGAEWESGEALLVRCKTLARQTGHAKRLEEATMFLTSLYYYSSQWSKARVSDEEFAVIARENEATLGILWGEDNQARWLLRKGCPEEARRIYVRTLEQYRLFDDRGNILFALGGIIKSYLDEGDLEGARAYVEEAAAELSGKVPTNYGLTDAYGSVIEYDLMRREASLLPIIDVEKLLLAFERYAVRIRLARPRYLMLLGWCQRLAGNTRAATQSGQKAVSEAIHFKMPYEEALAHIELARSLPFDDTHYQDSLNRALDILNPLGAVSDIERVERLKSGST